METEEILMAHTTELARQNEQIKTLFEQQKEIRELTKSTNNLTVAIEKLVDRFESVDKRVCAIEGNSTYKTNVVWACVVTGVIGAIIAFVVENILL